MMNSGKRPLLLMLISSLLVPMLMWSATSVAYASTKHSVGLITINDVPIAWVHKQRRCATVSWRRALYGQARSREQLSE